MSNRHALLACASRMNFQLEHVTDFLKLVAPVLPSADEHPSRQYLYKSSVLMVQSHFEEYLLCVVALAAFYKAPAVRSHLAEGQMDPDRFSLMSTPELMSAAKNRVSFERGASQLKRLFVVLTGGSPFADEEAEQKCVDFANVRNIIAHAGGWPTESHAPVVQTPNVIIKTREVAGSTFYELRITKEFFGECLVAIGRSVAAIETRLNSDAEFAIEVD